MLNGLAEDRSQFGRFNPPSIVEIDLVVPSAHPQASLRDQAVVHVGEDTGLVVVRPCVQRLDAASPPGIPGAPCRGRAGDPSWPRPTMWQRTSGR